ncbi:hypothetical protein [Marivirga lumbricoides]|uniref:hypothetical protein n=1 Tax=Marivirga lumbricoides TaxID=1046115 RepID=UPI0031E4ED10
MHHYTKYFIITLAAVALGIFFWPEFSSASYNQLTSSLDRLIISAGKNFPEKDGQILFTIACGIIPIIHFGLLKLTGKRSIKDNAFILLTLIISGIVLWELYIFNKILTLSSRNYDLKNMDTNTHFMISQDDLNPELFFTLGIIFGAILVVFRYKRLLKNKR